MNLKSPKIKVLFLFGAVGFLLLPQAFSQKGTVKPARTGAYATAYFAAGCFWSTESGFEKHAGVIDAVSGYMGGTLPDPTYREVASETTGHRETVEVRYDPEIITYQELLDIFWRLHDPSDAGGAFFDRGESYTSAIFYTDQAQQRLALWRYAAALDKKSDARDCSDQQSRAGSRAIFTGMSHACHSARC